MARESAASLSVVRSITDSRLPTPAGLSETEAALWRAVIDSKPADWFGDDNAPLLKEYVRAALMCDALDERVKGAMAEGADVGEVKALLDIRDKESKRAASLATKLRLTNQSRYTPQSAATANARTTGRRPWQRS